MIAAGETSPQAATTEPPTAATATLASTSAPTAAVPTEVPSTIHIVVAGDSLTALAEANDIALATLLEANGLELSDTIFVGQELVLPPAGTN
jgi:LysM repeat protein